MSEPGARANTSLGIGERGCGDICGQQMDVFDRLPAQIRRHLNECERKYCSCWVTGLIAELGEVYCRVELMRTGKLPEPPAGTRYPALKRPLAPKHRAPRAGGAA